jgi:cGMP-dependent protein kinase
MVKGDSFGEQALYYKTTRGATVKALEPTICLALGRDTLTKILGDQVQIITFRNVQKWAFEKNPLLSQLSKIAIEKIVEGMKISNYKNSDVIIKKGASCSSKLIVIIEGSIKKVNLTIFGLICIEKWSCSCQEG